jgi:hypothetical protein
LLEGLLGLPNGLLEVHGAELLVGLRESRGRSSKKKQKRKRE